MVFKLGGGWRVGGRNFDQLENELGQVVDEAAALSKRQLLIDLWNQMGFCTPQLPLQSLHIGSPGLASFGL